MNMTAFRSAAAALLVLMALPLSPASARPAADHEPPRQVRNLAQSRAAVFRVAEIRIAQLGSAPAAAETTVAPAPSRTPPELSPWSMFLSADNLVKAVMVSLAFASLITWTIFIAMTLHHGVLRRRLKAAMKKVSGATSLAEARLALGSKTNVMQLLIGTAVDEIRTSADSLTEVGVKERVATHFSEIFRSEARVARQGMGVLATIGSVSPFVGLFGTVWGIMNSFIGISKSQTTNLAVVAPGIAEALLATALGLVAAIPAVIVYNHFSRRARSYLDLVRRAAGAAERLLSRDLDRARGIVARAAE
jgi:biopolymer transport protein ExbB